MRDRDLELIAALVEGRLDDETEARALIESFPEARAEYEAQRRAHGALTDLVPVMMTESERSALHRDVWSALRTEVGGSRPAATPWYARWLPATAAIAFALATVGVVSVIGGGQQSGDFTEIAADLGRATTTAGGESAGDGDDGGAMAPFDAPTTAAADAEGADGGGMSPAAIRFLSAEAARFRAMGGPATTDSEESSEGTDLDACLQDAGLEEHVVVDVVGPEEIDGEMVETLIAAVPRDAEVEDAPVTFVAEAGCQVVYTDE